MTHPERPVTILPHAEIVMYVGSPVWVRLLQDETEFLGELPLSPPKEAWVGESALDGELCYSTRTPGRRHLEQASLRPHRVTTAVSIHNGTDTPFVCSQVNLPVKQLSVYGDDEDRLWTESVNLERSASAAFAKVSVGTEPGPAASGATRLSGSRETVSGGIFRAFGTLFR